MNPGTHSRILRVAGRNLAVCLRILKGLRVGCPGAAAWRRTRVCALALVWGVAGNVLAWGPEGHKWIHARAVELLPADVAAVLGPHRAYLVEHGVDPDLWREHDPEENPRHFVDLDRYGDFPFPRFMLDYEQMLKRHGLDKLKANGTVLWTIPEVMSRLEKAFRSGDRDAMLREAVALGHYLGDLHQPFHAVANYDGQLTGQKGIHWRFEGDVANRVLPTLKAGPGRLQEIRNPLQQSFDIALDSFSMVDLILIPDWKIVRDQKIDRNSLPREPRRKEAIYPESYFRAFVAATGSLAARRMQEAAWVVASFWTQAWKNSRQGGR